MTRDAQGKKMTPLDLDQLSKICDGIDVRSSDRAEDRARQKLRRAGLIVFRGLWFATSDGSQALALSRVEETK